MMIVITGKKPVLVPMGRLPFGIPVDVHPTIADDLIRKGEAVAVETKAAMDNLFTSAGVSQSALPADQASPSQTASESGCGDSPKRRGRQAKKLS